MPSNYTYLNLEVQRTAAQCGGWTREATCQRRLAVAVTWSSAQGHQSYDEHRAQELIVGLQAADCVVGFNCRNFDFEVIHGHGAFVMPTTLDLLTVVAQARGFRIGLESLAQGTFGHQRLSDGDKNTALWREGNRAAVEAACRHDVDAIRRLHEHMMQEHWLAYFDSNDDWQQFEVQPTVLTRCIH